MKVLDMYLSKVKDLAENSTTCEISRHLEFRFGKTGSLGPWSRVMVFCKAISL